MVDEYPLLLPSVGIGEFGNDSGKLIIKVRQLELVVEFLFLLLPG